MRALILATALFLSSTLSSADPDTSHIMAVIGRFSAGHACPISTDRALTNAHVVDMKPFDLSVGLYPFRWSDDASGSGDIIPIKVSARDDLAIVEIRPSHPHPYSLSPTPPKIGDQVWWVGYDWRKTKTAFSTRVFTGRITQIVAGQLIIGTATTEGSSGSCVLDAQGKVVGVIAWGKGVGGKESRDEVTVAPGVWGMWLDGLLGKNQPESAAP